MKRCVLPRNQAQQSVNIYLVASQRLKYITTDFDMAQDNIPRRLVMLQAEYFKKYGFQ